LPPALRTAASTCFTKGRKCVSPCPARLRTGRGGCQNHLGNRRPSRHDLRDDFAVGSSPASTSRRCARIPASAQKRRCGRSFSARRVPVSRLESKDDRPGVAPRTPRIVPV
jgi:hypothetical protein